MASTTGQFAGKVITVTGGASGIGLSTVKHLLGRDASVAFCDVSKVEETLASLSDEFQGAKIFGSVVDITDAPAVELWINNVKENLGKIDGCVNSAGVAPKAAEPLTAVALDEWDRVIGVNLTGTFNCMRAELKAIEDGGSVVNVASSAGLMGAPFAPAYVASKHGVIGLTRLAAMENAARKIRVNAVCPGLTKTPMMKLFDEETDQAITAMQHTPQLFKWLAMPEEVAALIGFLLSDDSRFVTKATYSIDGGWCG